MWRDIYETKLSGETTEQDEEEYSDHQASKRSSRNEKTKGKARAKTDKTFVAATFDLGKGFCVILDKIPINIRCFVECRSFSPFVFPGKYIMCFFP
jgi:hypothetical protein